MGSSKGWFCRARAPVAPVDFHRQRYVYTLLCRHLLLSSSSSSSVAAEFLARFRHAHSPLSLSLVSSILDSSRLVHIFLLFDRPSFASRQCTVHSSASSYSSRCAVCRESRDPRASVSLVLPRFLLAPGRLVRSVMCSPPVARPSGVGRGHRAAAVIKVVSAENPAKVDGAAPPARLRVTGICKSIYL